MEGHAMAHERGGTQTMAAGATKLTYEDLVLFPDDGKRHELIDGEHFVSAAPNLRHQAVSRNLFLALAGFVRERKLGELFYAPVDIVFSRHDVVEPDLLFVSAARKAILPAANVQGSPDLLVEILSPSNRRYDEILKRDLYERTEVDEYWLVDPESETVKVYRREAERFGRPVLLSLREGDALATPLLPGLELPLATVFDE
jgi:Uma2 family endonuclease